MTTIREELFNYSLNDEIDNLTETSKEILVYKVIQITKGKVEAALKEASENAEAIEGYNTGFSGNAASVDKDSILNAYPLENIK